MAKNNTGPLDRINVIGLTSVVLGPLACQILAYLGADVVRERYLIESGVWQFHEHPTEGTLHMPRHIPSQPYTFCKTPAAIQTLPPRLGPQSIEIIRETGYSDGDMKI